MGMEADGGGGSIILALCHLTRQAGTATLAAECLCALVGTCRCLPVPPAPCAVQEDGLTSASTTGQQWQQVKHQQQQQLRPVLVSCWFGSQGPSTATVAGVASGGGEQQHVLLASCCVSSAIGAALLGPALLASQLAVNDSGSGEAATAVADFLVLAEQLLEQLGHADNDVSTSYSGRMSTL